MIDTNSKEIQEEDLYTKEYEISQMVNKIVGKNTPWIWFTIGIIIFVFGRYDIFTIIGAGFLCVAFFVGGKQFGHNLGFKDGWHKLENRG